MMRLLLSSFGFRSPIMREKFAMVIKNDITLRNKTCLVLPYAGFNLENTFQNEKNGLIEFGFSPENIIFVKNREDITRYIPDYIYVPGGDPFKLLDAIRKMGIMTDIVECVTKRHTVYIGVSAGADIATKSIEYVTNLEDNNVIRNMEFEALGLIQEGILCHADHYSYSTVRVCREAVGNKILTIADDQLLTFINGEWNYVGEQE